MAVAFEINYTFVDDSGNTATTTIHVPQVYTLPQYTEFARAMAALVDDIVSGVVQSAELTVALDISSLTGNNAQVGSDVEEIGGFKFATVDGRAVTVNIPGINESMVEANSDDLDQLDPDVSAFISAMMDGIAVAGGTAIPCDVEQADLVALDFAREQFRPSGKRR
jgi:hypothetical protein